MSTKEEKLSELSNYYRDQFITAGQELDDSAINTAFDKLSEATDVDDVDKQRKSAYAKVFEVLNNRGNEFMMTDSSLNNGEQELYGDGTWSNVTNGTAAFLLETSDINRQEYQRRAKEADDELKKWDTLFSNAATDAEKEKYKGFLDTARAKSEDLHAHFDTADASFQQYALKNEIAVTKRQLSDSYREIYVGAGDTNHIDRCTKKLACLEIQYFNQYEKNVLSGKKLESRQSYIDELVKKYPDEDGYKYSFGANYRYNNYAYQDHIEDYKEEMGMSSEDKTESSDKSDSKTGGDDKQSFISEFESKYPNGNNNGFAAGNEFVNDKNKYIRCKQDLGITLSTADKQWVIDNFEKNPPHINSRADQEKYTKDKAIVERYKRELGVQNEGVVPLMAKPKEQVLHKNPYECSKPVRSAGITDAVYADQCKQAEQDHIAKINNEMADKVIRGDYGCGQERFDKLSAEGYDYSQVQAIVNQKMAAYKAQAQAKTEAVNAETSIKNAETVKTATTVEKTDDILARVDAKAPVPSPTIVPNEGQTLQRVTTPSAASSTKSEQTVYVANDGSAAGLYVDNEKVATKMEVENAAYAEGITDRVDNTAAVNRIASEIDNTTFSHDIAKDFDNTSFSNRIAGNIDNTKFSESIAADIDNTVFGQKIASDIDNSNINHRVDDNVNKALASNIDNTVATKLAKFNKAQLETAKTGKNEAEIELGT